MEQPKPNYINAIVSADQSKTGDVEIIRRWLDKWDPHILQRLEAVRHRKEIYEVLVPEESLLDLPEEFVESRG